MMLLVIIRLTTASATTAVDKANAPINVPTRSERWNTTHAVIDIVTSRTPVPYATRRVRPFRMSSPCLNRRYAMANGHGSMIARPPWASVATSLGSDNRSAMKLKTGGTRMTSCTTVSSIPRPYEKRRSAR